MKTAITQYVDKIKEHSEQIQDLRIRKAYLDCACIAEDFMIIESEKQQIIKAYDDAFNYVVGGGFVAKTGEQYFEEMYGSTNKENLKL